MGPNQFLEESSRPIFLILWMWGKSWCNPSVLEAFSYLVQDEFLRYGYNTSLVLELITSTGKSLSEGLIFASTNPQYDDRLFIELQVQYIKIRTSNLGRTCCVQKLFWMSETISVHNMLSPGLSLEFSCIELVIQWTIWRHIVG